MDNNRFGKSLFHLCLISFSIQRKDALMSSAMDRVKPIPTRFSRELNFPFQTIDKNIEVDSPVYGCRKKDFKLFYKTEDGKMSISDEAEILKRQSHEPKKSSQWNIDKSIHCISV